MQAFARALFVLLAGAALCGCKAKIPGTYVLDFEQTKLALEKTAAANPSLSAERADALQLLAATRLTIRLLEDGKMETSTELSDKSAPTPPPRSGWWKQEGTKVLMAVVEKDPDAHAHEKEPDTRCDIDGARLRCFKPMPQKLFENYVLVKK